MDYQKKSVKEIQVKGKTVLLRCDFNVPLDKQTGAITDDTRIRASLATIEYLLDEGTAVVACSHLGRPKGEARPELSLAPAARRLEELLGREVRFAADVVGPDAEQKAAALKAGQILLLENLRFHKEEEKNDPEFAKKLASLAEVFVSDAFGTVHRAHASTVGVSAFLPAVSGLLVEKELDVMGRALEKPERPFAAVFGGAKVSDKIGAVLNLLDRADIILIGGGMAYTFLKAMGHDIGASLCEEDKLELARGILQKAEEKGKTLLLPTDHRAAAEFSETAEPILLDTPGVPEGLMGMDIGEKTAAQFGRVLVGAKTIVWNGPMGVFEFPQFARGTYDIARVLADSGAVTIVGGGDSAAAVVQAGLGAKMTHISTGGGASLEFLEGRELPGVACLMPR